MIIEGVILSKYIIIILPPFGIRLGILGKFLVFALELIDTSCGIHQFRLTCIVRVGGS